LEINGLLGLRGSIDFEGMPLMIYGKNIAGKSNIINLIRYLLAKPKRGKRYTEDLRLSRSELLPEGRSGSCHLYLTEGEKAYGIFLDVKKEKGRTDVRYSIKSGPAVSGGLPKQWAEEKNGRGERIWGDLEGLKLYPDLLEVLISPSNVKNFEEAVSGELVSVPEMIRKEWSQIHTGTKNYLDTLAGLEVVLSQERSKISERMGELEREFSRLASKIEIDPALFRKGVTVLGELQQKISAMKEKLSEEKGKLAKVVAGEIRLKVEAYQKAEEALAREKEVEKQKEGFVQSQEKAGGLRDLREFLADVQARRIEDIISVRVPTVAGEDIAEKMAEAIKLVRKAGRICKENGIDLGDIKRVLPSYKELHRSIKSPLKGVKGVSAVVFRSGEKSVVSIPAQKVSEAPQVFAELEPLPRVHIEGEAEAPMLRELERRVSNIISKLESAKGYLREARKLVEEAKKLGKALEGKARTEEERAENLRLLLQRTVSELSEVAGSLKIFGIRLKAPESIEGLPSFYRNLRQQREKVEESLRRELAEISPQISPRTPLQRVLEEVQKRRKEIEERESVCRDLEAWLMQNLPEVEKLESKQKTIELLEEASTICKGMLEVIHKHTDISILVEQLSTYISQEVQAALQAILPESGVEFIHLGGGLFECRIEGERITHPAGSERACISIGVMVSLAKTFNVPVIFDEALDRMDADNIGPFLEYLTLAGQVVQICVAACKSLNIERNPRLRNILSRWRIYKVLTKGREKLIEPVNVDSIVEEGWGPL